MKTLLKTLPRKNFFTTLLILFAIVSHAQEYKNNWNFGVGVSLNFDTPPPTVGSSSINSPIHATSMSDDSGNLLFYSNAKSIWNSSNTLLTGLVGGFLAGDDQASQGISFQNPADQSQYYYFYLTASDAESRSAENGLFYSIIETASAPTLSMIAEDVEVFCTGCTGDPFSEALTAVPHCNGMDYWVIVHGDEELIVYLVTATGVTESGVYDFNLEAERGNLKASPDGTRLALSIEHTDGNLTIYDFDNITGVISNQIELIDDGRTGISFSPNSEVLYATNYTDELEIYDIVPSTPVLENTVQPIGPLHTMQLAKDGRIYIVRHDEPEMAVINDPDDINNFDFDETGFDLTPEENSHGIPNFVDAIRPSVVTAATISGGGSLCSTGSAEVSVALTGSDPWTIVYNDGTSNITVTGITSSPYVIDASSAGTYTLVSVTGAGCPGIVSGSAVVTNSGCACGAELSSHTWDNMFNLAPGFYEAIDDIYVTDPVTITDVILTMAEGKFIYITDGASLTLEHCHLYACTDMWLGIIVEPGGDLIITDGTLIEDAEVAVYINGANSSTQLTVDNAIFNKNLDGIFIDTYQSTASTPYSIFDISNTVFTCRSLPFSSTWPTVAALQTLTSANTLAEHYTMGGYATTTLKAPFATDKSSSGITLLSVGNLSGGTFYEIVIDGDNSNETFNLFDNLLYGINADNTNLTCKNNAFQYIIEENSWTDGIAINATDAGAGYNTNNRLRVIDDGAGGTNYFYDCTTGINAENYNDVTITDTDMRSTQMTPSVPLEGKGGMYINTPHCSQITVDNNTITNLRKGIEFNADAVAATVGGTPYTNAQQIGPVNITNNTIQANYSGVTLTNEYAQVGIIANNLITYTDYKLTNDLPEIINVSDNHLHDVYIGISMSGWRYVMFTSTSGWGNHAIAQDNYIKLRQQTYPTSGIPQVGIYHTYNYGNHIINNNVQGFGISSSVWAGIYSANITYNAHVERVECNLTENIAIGNYFIGDHGTISYRNNEMKTSALGLVLNNAIIGQQGDATNASDNEWTGSYPSGTFTTYTTAFSDPNNSVLYVQSGSPYDPATVGNGCGSANGGGYTYSSSNGIESSSGASEITCDALPSARLSGESNNENELYSKTTEMDRMERLVTENVMDYGIFPTEQYINAQHRVYRWLNILPQLKDSSTVLSDFYNGLQNHNISKLAQVENSFAQGNLDGAEALLSSITINNDIEANYKSYYTAYLHFKKRACTATDSLALWQLVNGCAARDGEIIYQARSLYNMVYETGYRIYLDDCVDSTTRTLKKVLPTVVNNNKQAFTVYPNPSMGEVWLKFEHVPDNNVEINVYSIEGTLVHSEKTTNPKINYNFSNGIYFIHVKTTDGYQYSPQRVTIIN